MNIGFIGLGIMGGAMAANLQNSGHRLTVFNRSSEKAKELLELGAQIAATPAETTKEAEVIITMLADPAAVEAVALGENGFLEQAGKGTIWVDCSTVDPLFSIRMSKAAQLKGIRFIDAPVTGTKPHAAAGELVFWVGGKAADISEVTPLLQAMGNKIIPMGQAGQGSAMKMIINLLLGHSMLAFSEALNIGAAMGLDFNKLSEILPGSPVVPPFVAGVMGKIRDQDYSPNFPLRLMEKDLQLVSHMASSAGVPAPMVNVAKEIFALARQKGHGDMDFSSIVSFLEANQV